MAKEQTKEPKERFALPKGRMINSSLFEKDQYRPEKGEAGKPMYKIEVAFPKEGGTLDAIFAKLQAFADKTWNEPEFVEENGQKKNNLDGILDIDGGTIISGVKDGDKLARNREREGKKGDAYKGMWVIRANTQYNADGQDAPGGVEVFDQNLERIGVVRKNEVYNGMYVEVVVNIGDYNEAKTGNHGITFYLAGVQKVEDGERLVTPQSSASLFTKKAVGRTEGSAASTAGAEGGEVRRRRVG